MSGAAILDNEALEAASEDRDECDCNKGNEALLRTLEDRVQPPVAAEPSERGFNHPADASGNELSVAAACDGLDRDAECLTRFCQSFASIAEVAERRALEAAISEFTQNRHDGFGVMAVRRCDIDRQRDAVFLHGELDLDATDLLAAVDATLKAARRRATGSTVDHHRTRLRRIAAGQAPAAAQSVEQAAPEAELGPAREQPVQRAEGDLAQLADRPPLHAAKADTPDRHDRLAQCRSDQRWLGSRSHRPAAVLGHSLKFRQHLVDEGINIGKRIPRARRGLGRTDGSSHSRASMLVLTMISSDCRLPGHHLQLHRELQSEPHQLAHAPYKQILIDTHLDRHEAAEQGRREDATTPPIREHVDTYLSAMLRH